MAKPAHRRVAEAVRLVRTRLVAANVPSSGADARALVGAAANTRSSLVLVDELPGDFDEVLERLVCRRERREPLQLILGKAPFRRLELDVQPGVFIPRPETEVGIDAVHEWWAGYSRAEERRPRNNTDRAHGAELRAIDACTGSGTLAAALADEFPGSRVHAFDANPKAVALAARNLGSVTREAVVADAHSSARDEPRQPGREARATVSLGRLPAPHAILDTSVGAWESLTRALGLPSVFCDSGVDLVVSNPPYIPAGAVPREPEVLEHDPADALFGGGADGLEVPTSVIAFASRILNPGGLLVMEHADVQGFATRELAQGTGAFTRVRTKKDLTGRDRFLLAVKN